MFRLYASFGALLGLSAVALASYASHAMAGSSATDLRRIFIAIAMQAIHALLLILIALWLRVGGGVLLHGAALAVLAGVGLFAGSLYGAVFGGWPTTLAPVGGASLMLGWLLFAIGALGTRR